jgi:hypothetical protein
MRLEFPMPREMLRALVTAVGALRRAGVARPADHVVMVSAPNGTFTALLVKKSPFTEPELGRLAAWADKSPYFDITAAPRRDTGTNLYRTFLELGDPQRERAFVAAYPFDISSTDDDRPFFFKYSFWWHIFPASHIVWAYVPVMEYSLILLLLAIGLAALVSIYVPLRHFAHQGCGLLRPGAGSCISGVRASATWPSRSRCSRSSDSSRPSQLRALRGLAALLLATGLGSSSRAASSRSWEGSAS